MFVPIVMDIGNGLDTDSVTFITFRRTLKKMLINKFQSVYGSKPDNLNTKQLMKILRKKTHFEGEIVKTGRQKLDATSCGILMAEIVYTLYSVLCTLDYEFNAGDKIRKISGIVQDSPRGKGPMEKIIYALDMVDGITEAHEYFDILSTKVAIETVDNYFEKMTRMTVSL
jgi:hypothetical protein